MGVEVPRIIHQAIEEAEELKTREDRARDLWRRTKYLLENKYTELRPSGGTILKPGLPKQIPILLKSFANNEGRSIEVEISPRDPKWLYPYEPNLNDATFRIRIGERLFWLPPQKISFGLSKDSRYCLPESETLGLLEELMTAIEEKRSTDVNR